MRDEQEWERCKTIQKWRDGASIPRVALGLGRKSLEGQGTQHVPTPLTQQRGLGGGYVLLGADRLAARWSERTPRPCPHSVGNDSTWEDSGCQGQRVRPRGTYSTAAAAVLGNQGRKMGALKKKKKFHHQKVWLSFVDFLLIFPHSHQLSSVITIPDICMIPEHLWGYFLYIFSFDSLSCVKLWEI